MSSSVPHESRVVPRAFSRPEINASFIVKAVNASGVSRAANPHHARVVAQTHTVHTAPSHRGDRPVQPDKELPRESFGGCVCLISTLRLPSAYHTCGKDIKPSQRSAFGTSVEFLSLANLSSDSASLN